YNMKKIFIAGSGIGKIRRGFEAHLIDLYSNLKTTINDRVFLLKGKGDSTDSEITVPNFSRDSFFSKILGYIIRKNPYFIQNTTFFLALIQSLLKYNPDIIYLGEPVVCTFLIKWRKLYGQKFKIIFYTGGQSIPNGLKSTDSIHFVSPLCMRDIEANKILEQNKFLIPHFLDYSNHHGIPDEIKKRRLRLELNIPENTTVILSVGAIDCRVKRMDYLIKEVSKLKEPIFLIILGE